MNQERVSQRRGERKGKGLDCKRIELFGRNRRLIERMAAQFAVAKMVNRRK